MPNNNPHNRQVNSIDCNEISDDLVLIYNPRNNFDKHHVQIDNHNDLIDKSMKKLYFSSLIILIFLTHNFSVFCQQPLLSNSDFIPLPIISFFDDYSASVEVAPNGTTINSVVLQTTMINGEETDPLNPVLGTEFYTDGEQFGDGAVTHSMNNTTGNTWNYSSIRPDDIYPEIFFVPTNITFTTPPETAIIDKSNYHLFKLNNPFEMVDTSSFFIEFFATAASSKSSIDLQVYLIGNNHDISFFEGSDWRDDPDVELVGTIGKNKDFHHVHTNYSKHHMVRLATNADRTIGNNHIDISSEFWIVLMAPTPSRTRSWDLRYHNKNKNGGRDNDGLTGQSLSAAATWFTGDEKFWTTTPNSGLPDFHVHLARSGYDNNMNEIKDEVRSEYIVDYTYDQTTTTEILTNDHQFQAIPNLPPNASIIIDPLPCEYGGMIDISWVSATDPNNDNLTYNVYILDESDGTVAMTAATGITVTSLTNVDISSLADGFYNIKIEACDASGCQSFLWKGLFANVGDHLYLGGPGSLFRTKGNGNWTNAAIWEENADACNSWTNTSNAPDNTHSGWIKVSSADSVVVGSGTAIPGKEWIEGIIDVQDDVTANVLILNPGAKIYCEGNWSVANILSGDADVILYGSNYQLYNANNNTLGNIKFKGAGVKTFEAGSYQINVGGNMEIAAESRVNQAGGTINVSGRLVLESSSTGNATFIPAGGDFNVADDSVTIKQIISNSNKVYSISVPASGGTTPSSAGITSGIFFWDNASGNWSSVASDDILQRGAGYMCKSLNDLRYSGDIAQVSLDAPLTRSAKGLGWNLLGNPFTAAIDWESVAFNHDEISDNFWIWNQEAQVYGVYSGSTQLGVNLDFDNPSFIPSGHSFWVKVNSGYSTSVFPFAQSSRVSNSHSYLKSAIPDVYENIKLFGHSGENRDEIAIVNVEEASSDFDSFDAEKMLGNNDNILEIFSLAGQKRLSINGQPLKDTSVIPVGFSVNQPGSYSISMRSAGIDGLSVFLEDMERGTISNLSAGESYKFEIAQAGKNLNRFLVSFHKSVATGIEESDLVEGLLVYSKDGYIQVKRTETFDKIGFSVFDISGRLLEKGILSDTSDLIGKFSFGTYLVAFRSLSGDKIGVKKIIVQAK